jgi:hypothetical protein
MNKRKWLISLIPLLGSFFEVLYLFFTDKERLQKAILASICGMFALFFVIISYVLICHYILLDLLNYDWILYIMVGISGIVYNIVYFLVMAKIDKNNM